MDEYRVKTEEELITEYGENWINCVSEGVGWNNQMFDILGKDYPCKDIDISNLSNDDWLSIYDNYHCNWTITKRFLIKKSKRIPNYKPKKFSREI
jgi:hypothetical protein